MISLSPSPVPRWYEIAKDEIGVKETSGPNVTPRIIEYLATTPLAEGGDSDETPWCSSFVNWALKQAGVQGTRSAAARSWLTWGEMRERRTGAIVIVRLKSGKTQITSSGYHVGFYVSSTDRVIRLLGGNQGNAVSEANFPLARWTIMSSRWPMETR